MNTNVDYWYVISSKILRAEMAKRKITYEDLVSKLQAIGVQINVGNLRVRVSKGAFSAALLIQCLRAMGIKSLSLEDSYFENNQ
jgi:hypothetical protein